MPTDKKAASARSLKWYYANRERALNRNALYLAQHPEERRQYQATYYQKHQAAVLAKETNRKARKASIYRDVTWSEPT